METMNCASAKCVLKEGLTAFFFYLAENLLLLPTRKTDVYFVFVPVLKMNADAKKLLIRIM